MPVVSQHWQKVSNASANPNHQTDEGMTPLMVACLNRHPRIVKLLLKNGADPNLQDSNNSTALTFANRGGCLESSMLLLTFGTDFNYFFRNDSSDLNSLLSQTPGLDTIDEGIY